MNIPYELKFLFDVRYLNGTVYKQNEQDVSERDPTKSCYACIDHSNIDVFSLRGADACVSVVPREGEIYMNGEVAFRIDEPVVEVPKVYYWRNVSIDKNMNVLQVIYKIGLSFVNSAGKQVDKFFQLA